jgi:ATP adenylyltransferase
VNHLWAPWRNQYISGGEKPSAQLFWEISQSSDDEGNFILHRDKASWALLNRYPYNSGHLLVLPYRAVTELTELSSDESANLWSTVNLMTRALKKAFNPHGFNIGINLGAAAGAGIPTHLHIHIVPRWTGDANFMTSTGETRVHPHDLPTTYTLLKKALAEIAL